MTEVPADTVWDFNGMRLAWSGLEAALRTLAQHDTVTIKNVADGGICITEIIATVAEIVKQAPDRNLEAGQGESNA